MSLSVSLALFEIGDESVTKELLLLLISVPNPSVVFMATIFYVIANTAAPEIVRFGTLKTFG
jgi:hypothetical protein